MPLKQDDGEWGKEFRGAGLTEMEIKHPFTYQSNSNDLTQCSTREKSSQYSYMLPLTIHHIPVSTGIIF